MGCTEASNAHRRCLRGSGQTQLREPLHSPAPLPRQVLAVWSQQCCHGSLWESTEGFSPSEYAESTGRGSLNPLCRPGQLCTNKNQGSLPEHVGPQAHRTPGAGVPRESLDKQFCRDSGARESLPRISCDIYRMIWYHTLVSGEIKVLVAEGVTGTPSQAANPILLSTCSARRAWLEARKNRRNVKQNHFKATSPQKISKSQNEPHQAKVICILFCGAFRITYICTLHL